MAASLATTLPTELIEQIFASVSHDDRPTCRALCMTNKLANKIATPLLYRTIGIPHSSNTDAQEPDLLPLRSKRLQTLLRTVISKPALSQHVHLVRQYIDLFSTVPDLSLANYGANDNEELDIRTILAGTSLPLTTLRLLEKTYLETRNPSNTIDPPGALCKAVPNPGPAPRISEEFCLILILIVCKKVKRLELSGDMSALNEMSALQMVARGFQRSSSAVVGTSTDTATVELHNRHSKLGFHTVQEVKLSHTVGRQGAEERTGARLGSLELFLGLPGLVRLSTDSLISENRFGGENPATFDSTVQELEVTGFTGDCEDVEWLLHHGSELRFLRIEWAANQDYHTRDDWFEISAPIRGLPKLEHLVLDVVAGVLPRLCSGSAYMKKIFGIHSWRPAALGPGPISMRTLTLPHTALFGNRRSENLGVTLESLMPDSIEEVTVVCEYDEFGEDEMALLGSPGVERLKNLTILNRTKDHWISTRDGEGFSKTTL